MKRYDTYKDSGIEWIGEIPSHWMCSKLKYITSKIIDGSHFTPTYISEGIPFLRVTDIQEKEINIENVKRIPESEHKELIKRCFPEKGDVLLSKNGTIGITKIVDWDWEFSIFVSLCLLKFKSEINPLFFSYYFGSNAVDQQISESSKKTSVTNLHLDKIRELIISYPTQQEQSAIVTYLDRKTTEIDALIADKQRLVELYKEEKVTVINQAVTKGVNSKAKMKHRGIDWFSEIPAHWQVKRIKYVIKEFESGVSVNSLDNPIIDGEYGILKTSCVYDYTFRPEENKLILNELELSRAKTNPKKGMIIISRMNTPDLVGASGYVDKDYPNLFLPDRLWQTVFHDNVEINSIWLSFILKSISFRKLVSTLATGTSPSMKNIGQEDFLNIMIPFPDKEEQQSIVHHIETQCTLIDAKIAKTKKLIELLSEYRTALISEVVTGKIKVTD